MPRYRTTISSIVKVPRDGVKSDPSWEDVRWTSGEDDENGHDQDHSIYLENPRGPTLRLPTFMFFPTLHPASEVPSDPTPLGSLPRASWRTAQRRVFAEELVQTRDDASLQRIASTYRTFPGVVYYVGRNNRVFPP